MQPGGVLLQDVTLCLPSASCSKNRSAPSRCDEAVNSRATAQNPLVRRACEGDSSAIEGLYHQYRRAVFGVAYRMLDSVPDAEDVTHDVFLDLPKTLRTYEGRGQLEGWIKRVAARRALMRLRRQKIQGEVSIGEWLDSLRSTEAGSLTDRVTLDDAIRKLPEHLRIVVVMKMVEGFTYTQIGEALGLHVNAAKARIHRARQLLQAYLQESH